jgi:cytochrome P450
MARSIDAIPGSARSDIELFSDTALADPYPLYRELRDIGPAAYLNRHECWFIGRHEDVRRALGDWQTFSSAKGIGLNATINHAWANALICVDPPVHTEMRTYLTERLSPRALKPVEQIIDQRANELAERIVTRTDFDAVTDVAQELPVNVIMDLIGWPDSVRGSLLGMAEGSFDACGPDNERMRAALPRLAAMMQLIAQTYDAGTLAPGGFGSTIADAARRGDISRDAAIGLLAGYVVAAFDTTINGIASGIWLFARHPEQWDRLRNEPSLVMRAFNEILRMETPIQSFSRVTTRDVDMGESIVIPAGSRVIISYASANRDERHFGDPQRFDIKRTPSDHLAFGAGNHGCAGQGLARLEAHAVFKALALRVNRFELAGTPVRQINNITRGFAHIPLRATARST